MEFTAQEVERFVHRRALILLNTGEIQSGKFLPPDWSEHTVPFEAEPKGSSVTYTIRKFISITAMAGIWDHESLWNTCSKCNVAPGDPCRETGIEMKITHAEREALYLAEEFRSKEEEAKKKRDELAAKAQYAAGPVVTTA